MENSFIKLNKVREFGDVFNDTFALIKQEAKPFGKALAAYALPLLLVSSISMAYLQAQNPGNIYGSPNFNIFSFLGKIALLLLFVVLAQNMLMVTVYSYFKLYYTKGPRNFDNNDVFHEIARNFFPCFFVSLLLGIIVFSGLMLCILPGIYLAISLSFVIPLMIIEKKEFGMAFSRSFDLSHKQWWWTLLIIIVYVILAYVFMIILTIPGMIFGFTTLFKNIESLNNGTYAYPVYMIVYNAVVSLLSSLAYSILHIAILLQYFNIVELFEGKSLSEKIDLLVKNDPV